MAQTTTYTSYDFTTVAGAAGVVGSADGTGVAARFSGPEGLGVDAAGNIYVADHFNYVIRKVSPGGVVTTLAGTPGVTGSADGTGAAAQFTGPVGLAVDAGGNVYVGDNYTIRKVTPGGVVTTLAGQAGLAGNVDGTGAAARFASPVGVAVDTSGNVYVADWFNEEIRKITPSGVTTTLAGLSGFSGHADGTGSAARFSSPVGIAVDSGGNVYVADTDNAEVRKITPAGMVTTLAGAYDNQGVSTDGTGGAARFNFLQGIAVDAAGNVYVTCSNNGTVRRVTSAGVVTTLAGISAFDTNTDGIGPTARFQNPFGIVVDASGTVYVSDVDADTIRKGIPVVQAQATVSLGDLTQSYDGTSKPVSVTTEPAGLATLVVYSASATAPTAQGAYQVFATITDPAYTGSANGTLTIGPGASALSPFVVRHAQAGGSFLWGIAAGPRGLVAVGVGGDILSSTDGATWTHRDSGTTQWLVAVAYGAGQYVAVGDNGTVLLSADAATWTSVAQSATSLRLNNVIYAAGQFVAVGEGGTIISSPDGRNWAAQSSGVTGWLRGLAYVPGFEYEEGSTFAGGLTVSSIPPRFVAAGQGGAFVTSTDGVSWSPAFNPSGPSGGTTDLEALAATGMTDFIDNGSISSFVAVGTDGGAELSEWGQMNPIGGLPAPTEGLATAPIFIPADFRAVVRAGSNLVAAGDGGALVTAPLLSAYPHVGSWSLVSSGTTASLAGAVTIGDSVFVVGDNETILESTPPADSRLTNLSCRSQVGTGGNALIAGFVVGGRGTSGSAPLLLRASGPALVPFAVPGTLADPDLQLFGTGPTPALLAANTGWGGGSILSNEAAELGAFAWTDPTSHDAALFENLPAGPYTANISGETGDTGVALAEVYDATPPADYSLAAPRLVNLSARAQVGTGGSVLIAGFVIGGTSPKTVLIRASGPALVPFGVAGALPDPKLQVFGTSSATTQVAGNAGWAGDPQIATAAAWVGAFSWGTAATKDSAILVTLPPGSYTANVSGASGDTGVSLVEVYEVQ